MNGKTIRLACLIALLMGLAGARAAAEADAPAKSDDELLVAIKHLVREGRHEQALPRIDAYLAANPGHAEARFLQGLVLVEQGRGAEAVQVFEALTRDYPALPEPHNNLAVLHAADGNYARAREELLAAIKTYPSYATAHENLGDIYARMARVAYGKALEIDDANATARAKLTMVDELFSTRGPGVRGSGAAAPPRAPAAVAAAAESGAGTEAASADAATAGAEPGGAGTSAAAPADEVVVAVLAEAAPAEPAPAESAPAESASAESAPDEPSPAVAVPGPAEPRAPLIEPLTALSEPTTDAVLAPARDVAAETQAAEAASEQPIQAVRDTLSGWARAWTAQNVDDYLAFYDPGFEPSVGLSRAHWEIQRRTRVTGPDFIEVTLDDIDIDLLDADHASVIFSQHYRSDSYRDTVRKTMTLVRDGAAWKITSESALD